MKHYLFCILLMLFIAGGNKLFSQQSMHSSGGDGIGAGGSLSYSFGQFACESFFEGNSSVSQGVQQPFELFDSEQFVPNNDQIVNTTFAEGVILCYNAIQMISVAGIEGPVEIQANATVEFIAGESIRLLPGFHAQLGSNVLGRITTTSDFCDGYIVPNIVQAPPLAEKSTNLINLQGKPEDIINDKSVIVYPNPNNGRFTIDLQNFENKARVFVYNQLGVVVFTGDIEQSNNTEIELSSIGMGLYYVRVVDGNQQFVNKIIVN